jgi:hypothetical protein
VPGTVKKINLELYSLIHKELTGFPQLIHKSRALLAPADQFFSMQPTEVFLGDAAFRLIKLFDRLLSYDAGRGDKTRWPLHNR